MPLDAIQAFPNTAEDSTCNATADGLLFVSIISLVNRVQTGVCLGPAPRNWCVWPPGHGIPPKKQDQNNIYPRSLRFIMGTSLRVHTTTLKTGITRTPEFEKKGLAQFAVNVGAKCGHGCLYCSTGAMLSAHPSFKEAGENPYLTGYAIVDPNRHKSQIQDHVIGRA